MKLLIGDAKAINYILSHGSTYEKWEAQRERLHVPLGDGMARLLIISPLAI